MDNLKIYKKVKEVPVEAQKKITGGRLNGMTDINPMWRIKTLTELFGPCGKGWYTEVLNTRFEHGADGEIGVFVDIHLYVKFDDEWSKPIYGTGGSKFSTKESKGLYNSDEAVKMAYTDALSISCKALGFCADIYYSKDRTKYDNSAEQNEDLKDCSKDKISKIHLDTVKALIEKTGTETSKILEFNKVSKLEDLTVEQGIEVMGVLQKKVNSNAKH